MRELIRMMLILTVICGSSAIVLSYAHKATEKQRQYQILKYVKEPSIKAVLSGYSNDPIKDRFMIKMGKDKDGKPVKRNVFPAKKEGEVFAVAYGSSAMGYHDLIEVMVGINMEGEISGISIMSHTETPGLGARIVEPEFTGQFQGLKLSQNLNLASQGGKIDSVSGATYSTKGVINAVRKALEHFPEVKKEVI